MKFRKFGRISSAALAAAVAATSIAIVSSAYDINGVVEYSDFGAQIWAMGTTNWGWTSGGTVKFENGDTEATLTCTAKAADLNPKGDGTVQFGLQFYTDKDGSNNAEFEIGDSFAAKADYKITGANGTISEGTIDISKEIVKDQYNPGIDGTFDIYKVEIPKSELDSYGDITATVTVYDMTYVKGGVAGAVGVEEEEETTAEEETEAPAEEETPDTEEVTDTAAAEETTTEADDDDDDDDTDTLPDAADVATDYTPDEVNDNGYFRILSGADTGEASLFTGMTDEILDVYGVRYTVAFDAAEVADDSVWIGGGMGANSESTGWESHEWGKAEGEKEITPDFETGVIEWMDTEPIFSADDTYAHLWLQTWGGNVTILQIEVLDENGDVIWATTPVEVEEAPAVAEEEEAAPVVETPAAGAVDAAAESSKGSPDTGVADVAAAAGLALAAAGAFVIAKKRK
ncbi:MAG: hypothetical protein K5876_02360 [Ruminiclostridium sp.]|nr:hypothetical protein [Ruminiclostridium sp.]